MSLILSPKRTFHFVLMANELSSQGRKIEIISGAKRSFFANVVGLRHSIAPLPFAQLNHVLGTALTPKRDALDSIVYDHYVASQIRRREAGGVIALAASALRTGLAAHELGMPFVLDRACPHARFQQNLLKEESDKFGLANQPQPDWFVERQEAEYDAADLIICPSRYSADTFPDKLRKKIVIAPLLGRAITVTHSVSSGVARCFRVGVLGGHSIRKGFAYLFEAWARLNLPNARLVIRSSGISEEKSFSKFLQREDIEIVEYVDDISNFYRKCDVFILPSIDDGFGMAAFEAMACGVPTIITDHCGASELIIHGENGHVIPARNSDAIVDAIEKLYRDHEYREYLGQNARIRVESLTGSPGQSIYGLGLSAALSRVNLD